ALRAGEGDQGLGGFAEAYRGGTGDGGRSGRVDGRAWGGDMSQTYIRCIFHVEQGVDKAACRTRRMGYRYRIAAGSGNIYVWTVIDLVGKGIGGRALRAGKGDQGLGGFIETYRSGTGNGS